MIEIKCILGKIYFLIRIDTGETGRLHTDSPFDRTGGFGQDAECAGTSFRAFRYGHFVPFRSPSVDVLFTLSQQRQSHRSGDRTDRRPSRSARQTGGRRPHTGILRLLSYGRRESGCGQKPQQSGEKLFHRPCRDERGVLPHFEQGVSLQRHEGHRGIGRHRIPERAYRPERQRPADAGRCDSAGSRPHRDDKRGYCRHSGTCDCGDARSGTGG
jgi:hypothetical protein